MATETLQVWDYVVIILMLIISTSIGVYYRFTGGRQKTSEEYYTANRSMSAAPVAIGLMVSFLSAVSLLGASAENYVYGTMYVVVNLGYVIATPVVAYLYLPVFFKLQATSAFEYLEKRFGTVARTITSSAISLQLLLYTGIVLYAPALAVEATTGLSKTASIIVIGLVCTCYSSLGGIKAVLITDIFQALLMLVAVLTVGITAAVEVGGIDEIWKIAVAGDRIEFDSISADPTVRHTWWSLTFGGFFTYLSLYGVNQVQVQRLLTINDLKSAQASLWWSLPIAVIMSVITCFSGLAIYSKYQNCDPLTTGRISSTDQLMPLYVMDTLSVFPGLPGLFIAGIFSAGLSTVSAALNSLSAVILEDYVKPLYIWRNIEFPVNKFAYIGKALAFLVGLLCIAIAFLAQYLGGVLQAALTIFGVVGGPVLGLFTLGMFTESATQRGAVTGLLISLVFGLWVGFGQPKPSAPTLAVSIAGCNTTSDITRLSSFTRAESTGDSSYFYLYRISYMWYCPMGCLVSMICGYIASHVLRLFFKEESTELNPDLLVPGLSSRLRRKQANARDNKNTGVQSKQNF
ncbi:putative sodium-dependent multivitamin transporter isoform X1 [Neodiprion virginianus]|uniref:putative sodium-dependent multivitamin transporter isoform X1 n=2 Tax=Neodiprion virginianus TaxID=2961670 RepID=UPI001EE77C4E|nr:putative sodium-dependent multivitamin transporter isoform X1 [Neodiprion virginianus]XP_046609716.1 putative sodium-dependent multivitamin transporter isoform X1 [Neodiprion virginianus]XP_046609717.1 putative sodium-dependent multivitamin transporter isoform X1 [Neodiprion virginianus]XP_046609718.1 putative sodium-dependent multivitamin transporter isoform X1 [Neodiprion virginianus]XP_046609719.1 putative sodium-dependent multivitamin transporter isoform X1 [Neodiprion virginianus]